MDKPDTHPIDTLPRRETLARPRTSARRPPPMRVVTKGWWTLEETTADIEDLKREDADERK